MLTTHYRQPRHQLPEFLLGRPRQVQATCIGNMEKAKKIKNDSIISMATDDCYEIKSKSGGTHTVDICNGVCTCKSFTLQQIPCKHMFVVLSQSNWSWNDLPKSLTNSVNLTPEVPSFSMDVKDEEMDEETVPDMGIPEETIPTPLG